MRTHGPVVTDVFHRRYLLQRLREPELSLTGQERLKRIPLYELEVQNAPLRIENHDALVCELIGLQGCVYEDAMQAMTDGLPVAVVNEGLSSMHDLFTRVLNETDVMEDLFLGAQSHHRLTALRCGAAYNIAVSHVEANSMDEGRSLIHLIHSQMSSVTAEEMARDELCSSIDHHYRALAFVTKTPL